MKALITGGTGFIGKLSAKLLPDPVITGRDKKRLVLIGGGHAHMILLAHLGDFVKKGIQVTVIQPSKYHYYSGMGAGMLGGTYRPDEIRFQTRLVVEKQGGRFIHDRAARIDPEKKMVILEGGNQAVAYDVLSCNAGSQVPEGQFSFSNDTDIFSVKPIAGLARARARIIELGKTRNLRVGIVGGGPSAVEIAGNIHQLAGRENMLPIAITIVAGHALLPHAPERVRTLTKRSLRRRGIAIMTGSRVRKTSPGILELDSGKEIRADVIFLALGVKPSPLFSRSGLPTGPDGGLRVNKYLQSVGRKNIFGGGDCIYFEPYPLDKVGVYAVRQNPVLLHNIMASFDGSPLQEFHHGGKYLLIYNLGNDYGVLSKWFLAMGGRSIFMLKDYIDRKFMRTYQALEH